MVLIYQLLREAAPLHFGEEMMWAIQKVMEEGRERDDKEGFSAEEEGERLQWIIRKKEKGKSLETRLQLERDNKSYEFRLKSLYGPGNLFKQLNNVRIVLPVGYQPFSPSYPSIPTSLTFCSEDESTIIFGPLMEKVFHFIYSIHSLVETMCPSFSLSLFLSTF